MNRGLAGASAVALMLAGCATTRPAPPPVVQAAAPPPPVVVAVARPAPLPPQPAPPRSCVPRGVGGAPRYPDSDQALRNAPGAADRYQLMAAGRILRQKRLEELERVLAACR